MYLSDHIEPYLQAQDIFNVPNFTTNIYAGNK